MNEKEVIESDNLLTAEELNQIDDLEDELEESFSEKNTIHSTDEFRCFWCNEFDSDDLPLYRAEFQQLDQVKYFFSCTKEHEEEVIDFYNKISKWKLLYNFLVLYIPFGLLVFSLLSIAIFSIDITFLLFYVIFISLGVGLIFFPLLGKKTVEGLGLKRSISLGRVLGGVLLIIGITLILIHGYSVFL